MAIEKQEVNARRDALGAIVPTLATAALLSAAMPARVAVGATPPNISKPFVTAEDFGAVGNGIADDTISLQQAIDYCIANKRTLFLKAGTYKVTKTLLKPESFYIINIFGDGANKTIIKGQNFNGPILKLKGGSAGPSMGRIANLTFEGSGANIGVEVADQCNFVFEYCEFKSCSVGIQLHNENGFTEFVKAFGCTFSNSCELPLELKRTLGDASFHGCGIIGRSIIDTPEHATSVIKIGPNCFLYNAEFDMQIFTHHACTVFDNQSAEASYASGTITLEPQTTSTLLLASGRYFPFAGTITGLNSNVIKLGALFLCESVYLGATGGLGFTGGSYSNKVNAVKVTTLNTPLASCMRQVHININAPNYVYRALLFVEHNGFGDRGTFTISHLGLYFNGAGYGQPSFSVDNTGRLIVTNNNFPNSGVTIGFQEIQIGQSMNGIVVGA